MIKKVSVILLVALCLIQLCGCRQKESHHDLHLYLDKADKDAIASQKKVKINLISQPVAVTYQKSATRSPFEETNTVSFRESSASMNPVNRYPLNLLRFVGVISQNSELQGYIVTPDDKMFPVSVGDIIGDHNGKVVKIESDKMEIVEQFSEGGKAATQRIVTLQLKDEPSNAKK